MAGWQRHFRLPRLTLCECERKWFYRYACAAVEDPGSSASAYGTAFHSALEDFHEQFPRPNAEDESAMRHLDARMRHLGLRAAARRLSRRASSSNCRSGARNAPRSATWIGSSPGGAGTVRSRRARSRRRDRPRRLRFRRLYRSSRSRRAYRRRSGSWIIRPEASPPMPPSTPRKSGAFAIFSCPSTTGHAPLPATTSPDRPHSAQRRAARRATRRSGSHQDDRHRRSHAFAQTHGGVERGFDVGKRSALCHGAKCCGLHLLRLRNGLRRQAAGRSPAIRQLIALDLDADQRAAVEAPVRRVRGNSGRTGKRKEHRTRGTRAARAGPRHQRAVRRGSSSATLRIMPSRFCATAAAR